VIPASLQEAKASELIISWKWFNLINSEIGWDLNQERASCFCCSVTLLSNLLFLNKSPDKGLSFVSDFFLNSFLTIFLGGVSWIGVLSKGTSFSSLGCTSISILAFSVSASITLALIVSSTAPTSIL